MKADARRFKTTHLIASIRVVLKTPLASPQFWSSLVACRVHNHVNASSSYPRAPFDPGVLDPLYRTGNWASSATLTASTFTLGSPNSPNCLPNVFAEST
jgi:hypothetical protein